MGLKSMGRDESLGAGGQGWDGLAELCRRILHRDCTFFTRARVRLVQPSPTTLLFCKSKELDDKLMVALVVTQRGPRASDHS